MTTEQTFEPSSQTQELLRASFSRSSSHAVPRNSRRPNRCGIAAGRSGGGGCSRSAASGNGTRSKRSGCAEAPLLQPGVLRLRLHQNRNVGVGVFPEREEILVGSLRLDLVCRQSESSAQLQVRQCTDGIRAHDATMIEKLLKLG